jgi:hypothetical protein
VSGSSGVEDSFGSTVAAFAGLWADDKQDPENKESRAQQDDVDHALAPIFLSHWQLKPVN